jgi:hypothetical protein
MVIASVENTDIWLPEFFGIKLKLKNEGNIQKLTLPPLPH